jgi:DUF4097 and DUF4098 domain-containing protein YvlB
MALRLAALAPVVLLTGCIDVDLGGVFDHVREDFHYSFDLNPGATVELENSNGSVEISGWDQNTIQIDGTKYASNEARLHSIHIDINHSANSVSIRTVMAPGWHGGGGAKYTIRVPHRVELHNITSSNGAIRAESIQGDTRLKTSNGSIHVNGIQGALDAHSSNGTIEVAEVTGDTDLETSNGSIRAEVHKGRFEASTSNGTITARLMDADTHPVRLHSSNGRIDLTLEAAREVRASTSNSSITVHLPSSVNADISAHTTNSSIATDFDVNVHGGEMGKHRLEGRIGSGGPLIDLGTSNGSIRIQRL